MKLRELLKTFRLRSLSGRGEGSADNVDALGAAGSTMHVGGGDGGNVPHGLTIPPGYVPSQQDERPRH
jgi:hypothetical protein